MEVNEDGEEYWSAVSRPQKEGASNVPLASLLGLTRPHRGVALQTRALPHRPVLTLPPRRRDHKRRRLRPRLVRPPYRDPRRLPLHRAGLERPQPQGGRLPRTIAFVLGPHPSLYGHCRPADQLSSFPLRQVALGPQRPR